MKKTKTLLSWNLHSKGIEGDGKRQTIKSKSPQNHLFLLIIVVKAKKKIEHVKATY